MNWTCTAILSAAVFSLVSILDSYLLTRRMPGLRAFLLLSGVVYLAYGLILVYLFPLPDGIGIVPILVAIVSGIFRTAGVTIMIFTLKREEVSRVLPVYHTYPIFVAIIAIPLLGESLNYLQWLAIIIVVAAAAIISVEKSPSGSTSRLNRSFLLLFVSSLCMALSDTTSKYSLAYLSFWNVYTISMFCMCSIFWLVSIRPGTIKQLSEMERKGSTITILLCNEIIAPVAMGLMFWAQSRGPISLVSTILATRPTFVAIYSIILGLVFPGFLMRSSSRRVIIIRFIATILIVGSISIIYLT